MASSAAMYSAAVLDFATIVCFLLAHDTAQPNRKMTRPEMDLRSLRSLAQSASDATKISSLVGRR
jgi:hypothetical protein